MRGPGAISRFVNWGGAFHATREGSAWEGAHLLQRVGRLERGLVARQRLVVVRHLGRRGGRVLLEKFVEHLLGVPCHLEPGERGARESPPRCESRWPPILPSYC